MHRKIVVAVLFLLSSVAARAQGTIFYITSSSGRYSNVQTGLVMTGSGSQEQYTNFWTSGIGGGLTFSFPPIGPVRLGLDFRDSTRPGTVGSDTVLAGLKAGFYLPTLRLKPYFQASGGYVATRTHNISTDPSNPSQIVGGTFNNRYAAWEILGGIDSPVSRLIDVRLIEVGGGYGTSVIGSSSSVPNITLFTFSSGVVFHF